MMVALILGAASTPADPNGWQQLRFGMSRTQAEAALQQMSGHSLGCKHVFTRAELKARENECTYYEFSEYESALFPIFIDHVGPVSFDIQRLEFFRGALWIVGLGLTPNESDTRDRDHRTLLRALTEKYGKPRIVRRFSELPGEYQWTLGRTRIIYEGTSGPRTLTYRDLEADKAYAAQKKAEKDRPVEKSKL
jgi:hypothetical protein